MSIRITAEREIEDPRLEDALKNPLRRRYEARDIDPLDPRIESSLGRMLLDKRITEAEYAAGCRWRKIYENWLLCLEASSDLSDEDAEDFERRYKTGAAVLQKLGRRVFDSVNAVCVYEQPEELGDFEFTAEAARRGLHALADWLDDEQEAYKVIPAKPVVESGLLDVPRASRMREGVPRGTAIRQLRKDLPSGRLVLLDCEEYDDEGRIEIRKYNTWERRF